jgi:transcriptional regulator with XRE-family HTH domain
MHIGQIIRMLRIQRGLTQEQLALEAQVATSNVSRIENGLRQPSQDLLQRLAEALKTSVSLIYTIQEEAITPYPDIHDFMSPSRVLLPDSTEPTAFDIALSDESQTLLKRFYQLAPQYRPLVLEHIQMLKRLQDQENERADA